LKTPFILSWFFISDTWR